MERCSSFRERKVWKIEREVKKGVTKRPIFAALGESKIGIVCYSFWGEESDSVKLRNRTGTREKKIEFKWGKTRGVAVIRETARYAT